MNFILQRKFYIEDVNPLLKFAIPLIFSGLIESSIGFFSTLFLARLGEKELAAGALVSWLFATLMVILWGALTAVSVVVAQKHGEKQDKQVSYVLRDGILLALLMVVPAFLLIWNLSPILLLVGQKPEIVLLAEAYLHMLSWGLLPDFVMLVLLQFLIGLGHARTSMIFTGIWVPIAIFFNYGLMFGKFGFPNMGMSGIGLGMTLGYWITALGLVIYIVCNRQYKKYFFKEWLFCRPIYLKELIQIGAPMGIMYCIEIGFFLALTLYMGVLGNAQLAANQIVLQYLGILISVIFSLAQAVTVSMGHKIGEKNISGAARINNAGVFIGAVFMTIVLMIYWVFPTFLIAVDLNVHDPKNAQLVVYAKQFFVVCALFQVIEAVRIILFGSLRALKDTHFTLYTSIISFWCIALPLGYCLTKTRLESAGLWCGMVIGASCSVMLLFYRFNIKMRSLMKVHS